jgi:hypothetical protein
MLMSAFGSLAGINRVFGVSAAICRETIAKTLAGNNKTGQVWSL